METIKIKTKSRPSEVYCGAGALKQAAKFLEKKEVFVVTDSNVFALYKNLLEEKFSGAHICVVPAGEKNKTKQTLFRILDEMLAAGLHRTSYVAAVGGGVVGDMAGLAASLYMRGVHLVQIPTTLLAQVDSSVGGKTAIDYKKVKNVIGAFYQQEYVFCDPLFLRTLPEREKKCGMGEIIKTGILEAKIGDRIRAAEGGLYGEEFLREITAACIRFKARIVEADETEKSGLRKCLNLGHTTGHALELLYGRRSHGEYVLIGTWLESFIAEGEGICTHGYAEEVRSLVALAEPKISVFRYAQDCIPYALLDKKNAGSGISLILSSARGEFREITLSSEQYSKYLRLLQGERL